MKFFNKYFEIENFRWLGFHLLKTTFAFGYGIGKPLWCVPKFVLLFNSPCSETKEKKLIEITIGWLLLCFSFQIIRNN